MHYVIRGVQRKDVGTQGIEKLTREGGQGVLLQGGDPGVGL